MLFTVSPAGVPEGPEPVDPRGVAHLRVEHDPLVLDPAGAERRLGQRRAALGRHIRLTLAFDPSLTNAVQVAFGVDSNHDGDLAPEETALRVGCDCGVWFAREEVVVGSPSPTVESSNILCTTTTSDYDSITNWTARGAYCDWQCIDFPDAFRFPVGTNLIDAVTLLAWGEVGRVAPRPPE